MPGTKVPVGMAGAAATVGAAAYAGCRIGAAKGGGLKTADIVKRGQIARRSADEGSRLLPGHHWDGYMPWFRDQFEERTVRPFKHKAKYGALAADSVESDFAAVSRYAKESRQAFWVRLH